MGYSFIYICFGGRQYCYRSAAIYFPIRYPTNRWVLIRVALPRIRYQRTHGPMELSIHANMGFAIFYSATIVLSNLRARHRDPIMQNFHGSSPDPAASFIWIHRKEASFCDIRDRALDVPGQGKGEESLCCAPNIFPLSLSYSYILLSELSQPHLRRSIARCSIRSEIDTT